MYKVLNKPPTEWLVISFFLISLITSNHIANSYLTYFDLQAQKVLNLYILKVDLYKS